MSALVLGGVLVGLVFGWMWALVVLLGPWLLGVFLGSTVGLLGLLRRRRARPAVAPPRDPDVVITRRMVVLVDVADLPRSGQGQVPILLEEQRRYGPQS
jgi:hypothetical protein